MNEVLADLTAVLAVAGKDLRLELRSKEIVVATAFFAGLVVIILAFALGPEERALENAAAGALWTALAFAGTVSAAQSFQGELEDGALEPLLLYPVPRGALFLGKLLANWTFMLALGALLLPVTAAVFGADVGASPGLLLLTVALGTLGFSLIATFYAALTANLRARESLLPVLMFPVVVPVVLASVRASNSVLLLGNPAEGRGWVQLLAGFDLVYLVVCTAIFPFVVEE